MAKKILSNSLNLSKFSIVKMLSILLTLSLLLGFMQNCSGKFSSENGAASNANPSMFSSFVASNERSGAVKTSGYALKDDSGEFNALGATLMWAAWGYKYNREKLEKNLDFLSKHGFNYIRVLGDVDWVEKPTDSRWSDYDQVISGLTDLAFDKYGLRIEWTLIGGSPWTEPKSVRMSLIDKFVAMAKGREQKIMHFEVANEFYGRKMSVDELRELTRYMKDRTEVLVAASAGDGGECAGAEAVYAGGVADISTSHFGRTINLADGAWRPVRQPWGYWECKDVPMVASNNEPIGPGSSVASDKEPLRLVMGAVVSYISKLPLHVYHSRAGVGIGNRDGLDGNQDIWEMPGADSFLAMRAYLPDDITNWSRQNHYWIGHPFVVYGDDKPGTAGPEVSTGVIRAYAATSGDRFVVAPMGIKNYVRLGAKNDMEFDVLNPLTGEVLNHHILRAGEEIKLSGMEAFVIIGRNGAAGSYPPGSTRIPPSLQKDTLRANESLLPEQSLKSKNGIYSFVYQGDGNLVVYQNNGEVLWSSNTQNSELGSLTMQGDGNLVLLNEAKTKAIWTSRTEGNPDARLVLEDDGRLVIYTSDNRVIFETKAGAPLPTPTPTPTPTPVPTPVPIPPPAPKVACDAGSTWNGHGWPTAADCERKASEGSFAGLCSINENGCYGIPVSGKIYTTGSLNVVTNASVVTGDASLVLQGDGNLVIYKAGIAKWASNTAHEGNWCADSCKLVFQADGNLVLYKGAEAFWNTNTDGKGKSLVFEANNTYLKIIDSSNNVIWKSN